MNLFTEEKEGKNRPVFGGSKVQSLPADQRISQAQALAPILRGLCSSYQSMIGHFTDDERVLQFVNSSDLDVLAPLGTSCPDHFLRTKISPLVLNLTAAEDLSDVFENLFSFGGGGGRRANKKDIKRNELR